MDDTSYGEAAGRERRSCGIGHSAAFEEEATALEGVMGTVTEPEEGASDLCIGQEAGGCPEADAPDTAVWPAGSEEELDPIFHFILCVLIMQSLVISCEQGR